MVSCRFGGNFGVIKENSLRRIKTVENHGKQKIVIIIIIMV